MPPISWTSKWRWPSVRLAASRTVAKAGTRISSSDLPSASCFLNSSVRARSASSESCSSSFSSALMAVDARLVGADAPLIGGAEQLAGDSADHRQHPSSLARTDRALASRAAQLGASSNSPGNTALIRASARRHRRDRRRRSRREIGGGPILVNARAFHALVSVRRPNSAIANDGRFRRVSAPIEAAQGRDIAASARKDRVP